MSLKSLWRLGRLFPMLFPSLAAGSLRVLAPRGRRHRSSKTYQPNGKRAVARRLRQIEAGTPRRENGLAA